MKKKNKNLLDNPHLKALWMLAATPANPNPRYCWDLNLVVACDLIVRTKMPGVSSPSVVDEDFDLDGLLDECKELRR